MAIVSRKYSAPRLQRDGRRLVTYVFTDDEGNEYSVKRFLSQGDDVATTMAIAESSVVNSLREYELDRIIDNIRSGLLFGRLAAGLDPTLITAKWATPAEVQARLFQWFSTAPANDARYLVPAISALTDADLMTMLSIDQAAVDTIRARVALLSQINDLTVAADG